MTHDVSVRGTGGAIFAGILLIIGGVLWLLQGLAGIVHGSSYIESANTLITTSAGAWGWIHLIGGIIGVAAGFGVFPEPAPTGVVVHRVLLAVQPRNRRSDRLVGSCARQVKQST